MLTCSNDVRQSQERRHLTQIGFQVAEAEANQLSERFYGRRMDPQSNKNVGSLTMDMAARRLYAAIQARQAIRRRVRK